MNLTPPPTNDYYYNNIAMHHKFLSKISRKFNVQPAYCPPTQVRTNQASFSGTGTASLNVVILNG